MQVDREVSMPTRRALTLNQPDLASPREYAARFAKSGLGKSNFRSKIAKPIYYLVRPPFISRNINVLLPAPI